MIRYCFFVDDAHLARLKDVATKANTTVSEVIRYAIAQHLKEVRDARPKSVPAGDAADL